MVAVGASGAGPDPTRPEGDRGGEGAMGQGWESEASPLEDGVAGIGLYSRPDGEGAVVDHR